MEMMGVMWCVVCTVVDGYVGCLFEEMERGIVCEVFRRRLFS